MGTVSFTDLGEMVNAGLADGVDGRVQRELEKLPRDTFYWVRGQNPTGMTPYADVRDGVVVIEVKDDVHREGGRPSIGVKPPASSDILETDPSFTVFGYEGTRYKVMHKTVPF